MIRLFTSTLPQWFCLCGILPVTYKGCDKVHFYHDIQETDFLKITTTDVHPKWPVISNIFCWEVQTRTDVLGKYTFRCLQINTVLMNRIGHLKNHQLQSWAEVSLLVHKCYVSEYAFKAASVSLEIHNWSLLYRDIELVSNSFWSL